MCVEPEYYVENTFLRFPNCATNNKLSVSSHSALVFLKMLSLARRLSAALYALYLVYSFTGSGVQGYGSR
jgi:hypothetical protein